MDIKAGSLWDMSDKGSATALVTTHRENLDALFIYSSVVCLFFNYGWITMINFSCFRGAVSV